MELQKRYFYDIMDAGDIMKYNLPERVYKDLRVAAKRYNINELILFGSRAKGAHSERSDVDIAVRGGDFDAFYIDIKENIHSLLMFDIIRLDGGISEALDGEIRRDGVKIYEKA